MSGWDAGSKGWAAAGVSTGQGESLGLGVDAVSRRVRWPGRARTWPAVVAVSGALLVAACSTSARPARAAHPRGSAPGTHSAGPGQAQAGARPATEAASVRIVPAPYQLPSGVAQEAVLLHGSDLLIAGGFSQRSTATATVLRLNPATGNTIAAGRLAAATPGAAGATLNGRDYLFGGGGHTGLARGPQAASGQAASGQAMVQQIAGRGVASVVGWLPAARSGLAAVTVGGTGYLVGGGTGAGPAGDVLASTDGRHFRTVARLPVPVRDPAVAALGDQIWVFGGQAAAGPVRDIQRVTVPGPGQHGTAGAAVVGHLPHPVTGAAGFTLGGTLFVAGGQVSQPGRTSTISGQVLRYRPGSAAVTVAGQLPVPVAGAGVAVTGRTAYLVGGDDGVRPVPTVTRIQLAPDPPATRTASTPWLGRPLSGPHLAPGSDPAALPGDVLIADHKNNRLLIVDPRAGSGGSSRSRVTWPGGRRSRFRTTRSSPRTGSRSSPPKRTRR